MVSRIARERGMRDASRASALMRAILKDTCASMALSRTGPFTAITPYRFPTSGFNFALNFAIQRSAMKLHKNCPLYNVDLISRFFSITFSLSIGGNDLILVHHIFLCTVPPDHVHVLSQSA